jgi:hypothetical protein
MKVKELIAALERYPSDMEVLVDGYEEGYEPAEIVQQVYVVKNYNGTEDGIYGRHGTPYGWDIRKERPEADLPAVLTW